MTVLLAVLGLVKDLRAQGSAAPAQSAAPLPPSTNRFLFVLDTSAVMKKELPDILKVVQDILGSSANGQLHTGDSIGVWTFNEDVFTGNMPLQTWNTDDSDEITLRIAEFIRQQDFKKKSRLDIATTAIDKVVQMSDLLTIFIVSSGAGPIHGTPYDKEINTQYLLCLRDMGKPARPLVTVLQGSHGKIIRYTVNALPWPVVIPELPIPLKVPKDVAAGADNAAVVTPKAVAPATPAPTPAPTPMPPPTQPPSTAQTTAPSQPIMPPVTPPADTGPPISVASADAPPPVPTAPRPNPVQVAMNTPPPVQTPPPTTEPSQTPPASGGDTASTTALTPPQVRPPTRNELPLVPPRQPPVVQKTLPVTDATSDQATPAITPPAMTPTAKPAVTATTESAAKPAPATDQAPPKTLISQATALVKSYTTGRNLWLVGGVGLVVVAVGLLVLMRRSRPSGRVSLITQTMDDRRR